MTSKEKPIPNPKLRRERELHGWTHKDVADRIYLPDSHTVGRWERGNTFPNSRYREALCQLFGKSLEELGLLKTSASHEAAAERSGLTEVFHKIPAAFTSIIGREREITTATDLLLRPDVRLLTLVGAGGIGKTRLAVEVAALVGEHFVDGVCFVSLAALRDPAGVLPAIAVALGIEDGTTTSLTQQVGNALHAKRVLLFVDNMEHVIEAAPSIETLLQQCPGLKVLATSRQALQLSAEHTVSVPPLSLPNLAHLPATKQLMRSPAIALFVERAQISLPSFVITEHNAQAIAELCVRLDGLPLAIELAAARVKLFTPQKLLERLSRDLYLFTNELRTAPERQHRLDVLIQWSYDLLTQQEQWLFRHLSVFVGGALVETFEELFGHLIQGPTTVTEIVKSLLDKSLLQRTEQQDGEPRFAMLETIRRYALNRLEEKQEGELQWERYAAYYLALVERAAPHLKARAQAEWLALLEPELDNLRAVLQWLIDHQHTEHALRFCEAFGKFCGLRGYWYEERGWLEKALALPEVPQQCGIRGRVLRRAGHLAYRLRDLTHARTLMEQSIVCSREADDRENLVGALSGLALVLDRLHQHAEAGLLLRESVALAEQENNFWALANALENLGRLLFYQGNGDEAYILLQRSVALARLHLDHESLARFLMTLVKLEIAQGHIERAMQLAQESYDLAQELGTRPLMALALSVQGEVALFQGASTQARQYFEERIALSDKLGDLPAVASETLKLVIIALMEGGNERAAQRVEEARKLFQKLEEAPEVVAGLCLAGDVKRVRGESEQAIVCYREALRRAVNAGDKREASRCLPGLAYLLLDQGEVERASIFLACAESWHYPLDRYPHQRAELQQAKERARHQVGEQRFAQLWSEGVAASLEQILLMALGNA